MATTYEYQSYYKEPSIASTSNLRDPNDRHGSPEPMSNVPYPSNPYAYTAANNNYYGRPYSGPPPPYPYPSNIKPARSYSRWLPRNWGRKSWIGVGFGALIVLIIIIAAAVAGSKSSAYPSYTPLNYHLVDTFIGADFFDNFDYFYGYDPAQGFVHYSNPDQSVQMGLTRATLKSAVLRVDNKQKNASTGRHSARITSKNQYDTGLFIFDVLHTPVGCASWPAVWLTDQTNWPLNGEIDVIEAVNRADTGNHMTLHTTDGCTMDVKREQTGTALQTNCWNATDGNAGCGVRGPRDTFGTAANTRGGGVYAMELRTAGIRMWFFARNAVPADITALRKPQPDNWGTPLADFPSTDCDISSHFRNQSITVDIDVCGQWAGSAAALHSNGCPKNCTAFAATHPEAFDDAYWEFASFRVYQAN